VSASSRNPNSQRLGASCGRAEALAKRAGAIEGNDYAPARHFKESSEMNFWTGLIIGLALAAVTFLVGYQTGSADTRQEMLEHDHIDEKGQ
jgi:hypothetical protein